MHIATHRQGTFHFLYIGFFCQYFFGLKAENIYIDLIVLIIIKTFFFKLIEMNIIKKILFNMTKYNIQIVNETIFLKYRTRQIKATENL